MKTIIIKPLVSEKAEILSEARQQYTFIVDKGANKIEIGQAVAERYGVQVVAVNTAIMPSKSKNRTTKSGLIRGRVPSYKKAIVTLAEGDELDIFDDM
ncbi:MAG: 50S ribosomal protein L23 [Bacteroidota bacterium]